MKKELTLVLLVLLLISAGCLTSSNTTSIVERAPSLALEQKATAGFDDTQSMSESVDRRLIRRGSLQIEVDDFDVSSSQVAAIAGDAGGFVSGSNSYITGSGRKRGTITIRVPEPEFFQIVSRLEEVGEVKSKSLSSDDVTEEFIDLEARLNNLEKQEERLLEIFEKAETVEEILKVEEQLGRVRGEIESLTGRLRYLENQVTLATISVELFEPEPITRSFGLRNSLRNSIEAFINTTAGIIVFIGFILPIVIILALLFIAVRAVKKRK